MSNGETLGPGDLSDLNDAVQRVYAELKKIATGYVAGERSGHTLQQTALVHEAYARLLSNEKLAWQNQAHFLAMCAGVMRQILVDAARARLALKRGAGAEAMTLFEDQAVGETLTFSTLELDDMLEKLSQQDADMGKIIELRFFAGLNHAETMAVTGLSRRTLDQKWQFAKAWLLREMASQHG
ncbi:MAG: ECF-type sigma factor [Pseudomonadota bacterium]